MIRLYKQSGNDLVSLPIGKLAYEDMIQEWIAKGPELLGLDLLIIGKEVGTPYGGSIDLLGIDDEGNLAILELKRDRTPRDIIAQVLDYASWA
jgi:RecB family endonuclease NucS